MAMKTVVPFLLALAAASSADAQAFDGPPAVQARAAGGDGASVSAQMDVAAPPQVVWSTLADCAHATRFMPRLISCKIIRKGQGWEIREHILRGNLLKPRMRNVFRIDLTPNSRLAFHRVAGDWKRSEGVWTLTPIKGGTHVSYSTQVAIDGPVPVSWVRSAVAKGMPEAMLALRREAVSRARHGGRS